ncbi:hypothetical protein TL16_g09743 [Triparma laevis f. inornata]|uniref:ubiquitinyl hydrolase 1 n=1 Tax=Triparma laevis f. inornata TaxID=1714386 RepID=A0A9W7B9Y9_9STRA|nr:hypothetical protein TL16_g09743 [Triparma laevis f. inornata]
MDQREMKVIEEASGKDSNDYRKRKAEGSGNVDASGNFSIEVLRSALQTHSLTLVSYMSEAVKTSSIDLTSRTGFILNRDHHWFTIRQINNNFWNLNSMLEKPETISHFKLAAEVEGENNNLEER